jgi:hypothetical protein
LETYLIFFASDHQHHWSQLLLLVEWWYNTSYHTAIHMTYFEAIYGQNPPSVLSYIPGVSKVQEVEKNLTVRKAILCTLKENLVMAQSHMKQQADQGHFECQFVEGDQVFLHLQHYNKTSLKVEHFHKLSPKFYGPYAILKHMGLIAYQLALPGDSNLHHFFLCLMLKEGDWN